MSENKNDGGPAFPHIDYEITSPHPSKGMSLRDYFATHTDVEEMINLYLKTTNNFTPAFQDIIDLTVDAKYKIADAMLKERSK